MDFSQKCCKTVVPIQAKRSPNNALSVIPQVPLVSGLHGHLPVHNLKAL